MVLPGNLEKIYELQSLRGKILSLKDLARSGEISVDRASIQEGKLRVKVE